MNFTEKVMELFMNPENSGQIQDANGIGEAGDPNCGDFLRIFIKVKDEVIEDCSFQIFGCCTAVASSSMTTILAKGHRCSEAEKITAEDIVAALGGLPEEKIHCSVLGASALKAALENYRKENK